MIKKIVTPGLFLKTYIIIDEASGEAAVIDPSRDVTPILQIISENNAKVKAILETHVHADFVSGAKELKYALRGDPQIYCSAEGGKEWIPAYADVPVKDRQNIQLGSLILQAWHTPGHTPEHLIWLLFNTADKTNIPEAVFTGDLIFFGSVGRPDLLGEKSVKELSEKLYKSLFDVIPSLPDALEIFPAHGEGSLCGKDIGSQKTSTLGQERQSNPFLQKKEKDSWFKLILKDVPTAPSYFGIMKKMNISDIKLIDELPVIKETDPGLSQIIDLRSKEEFAENHIAKSINVPLGPTFINWVPHFISYQQPLHLIAQQQSMIVQATHLLRLIGFDQEISYSLWNERLLQDQNMSFSSFPLISVDTLKEEMEENPQLFVLDVRTEGEWQTGHIENAQHVVLNNLSENLQEIPNDRSIAVICGSGFRASIAASLLQKHGYNQVSNVQGGMQNWMNAHYKVVATN